MLPPLGDLHRIECWLLHHGLRLKVILRPALPRHGPHYECGALLISATEECVARKRPSENAERTPHSPRRGNLKNGAPARTCTSSFRLRRAACRTLTLRELKMVRHAGAAPAPAVWNA